MPFAVTDDDVKLHYQETGNGFPILFIHEFAGDGESWTPQIDHFASRYRCVAYNARGYPPSDVPEDGDRYSLARAVKDAVCLLDHLGIEKAHAVGFSMGSFTTLHLVLDHPDRIASATIAGGGYVSPPDGRAEFQAAATALGDRWEAEGAETVAKEYAVGPARVQLQNKNPAGWKNFAERLAGHSSVGMAHTMRGVQAKRPSYGEDAARIGACTVPALLMIGDEDEPGLDATLHLKRIMPTAGLVTFPNSGHAINLEETETFNRLLGDFLAAVEGGTWPIRDAHAQFTSAI
jgi:pimeloyl-ACP methyl ester carboxylesterase